LAAGSLVSVSALLETFSSRRCVANYPILVSSVPGFFSVCTVPGIHASPLALLEFAPSPQGTGSINVLFTFGWLWAQFLASCVLL